MQQLHVTDHGLVVLDRVRDHNLCTRVITESKWLSALAVDAELKPNVATQRVVSQDMYHAIQSIEKSVITARQRWTASEPIAMSNIEAAYRDWTTRLDGAYKIGRVWWLSYSTGGSAEQVDPQPEWKLGFVALVKELARKLKSCGGTLRSRWADSTEFLVALVNSFTFLALMRTRADTRAYAARLDSRDLTPATGEQRCPPVCVTEPRSLTRDTRAAPLLP